MSAKKGPRYELPEDRPASFDETGHHVPLNPADVKGPWRLARDWWYVFLIVIFLALPWTRFNGHQTVLLDIPNRRFALFGITFWAHDLPMVFFVLGILTVGLTWVTFTWGRVWCGWGCPQTVFIDRVYRRVERWIEGNHIARIRLNEEGWTGRKIWKKSLKWFAFWFISTNIAHSFTAYFVGAERLLDMSLSSPMNNLTPFVFVVVLTAILMFDFGWFREQFCMIMCPYGRFQSVMMDRNSLAVMYDEKRGEPRKGTEPPGGEAGDCVNCYRCVAVCPTGIDIRRGVQMECVACTACIDACDEIMLKVGKPRGLIRYSSEEEMTGGRSRMVRPASVLYGIALAVLVIGFSISVASRQVIDAKFIRAIETPYTTNTLDDGSIQVINHYRLALQNDGFDPCTVSLEISGPDEDTVELVAPTFPLELEGGQRVRNHVFFRFPEELVEKTGRHEIVVRVTAVSSTGHRDETVRERVSLVGPYENEHEDD